MTPDNWFDKWDVDPKYKHPDPVNWKTYAFIVVVWLWVIWFTWLVLEVLSK